uniref:Uncharacterized protein n=1 Tax=Solanum tuberosum TaxID=4113 RepID=M1DKU5_SOLTU
MMVWLLMRSVQGDCVRGSPSAFAEGGRLRHRDRGGLGSYDAYLRCLACVEACVIPLMVAENL